MVFYDCSVRRSCRWANGPFQGPHVFTFRGGKNIVNEDFVHISKWSANWTTVAVEQVVLYHYAVKSLEQMR